MCHRIFYVSPTEAIYNTHNADHANDDTIFEPGWYTVEVCPKTGERLSPYDGPYNNRKDAEYYGMATDSEYIIN